MTARNVHALAEPLRRTEAIGGSDGCRECRETEREMGCPIVADGERLPLGVGATTHAQTHQTKRDHSGPVPRASHLTDTNVLGSPSGAGRWGGE